MPTRRTSAAPASTSASAGSRSSSLAALSLLLLRAWSIQVLHGKQYDGARAPPGVPDGRPARARAARSSTRRAACSPARPATSSIDADAASLGTRNAHGGWQPEPGRRPGPPPASRGSAARAVGAILAARIQRRRPALAVRAGRRDRRTRTPRLATYLQERAAGSPASRWTGQLRGAIRRAPSAASSSACSARSARESSTSPRTRTRSRAKSSARAASRRRTTRILNRGFVRAKSPRRLARPDRRRRSSVPPEKQPPTLQLSIDTRLQRPRREGAAVRDRAGARTTVTTRPARSAVVIEPADGRDQGARELSDVQPEARGRQAELPRAALPGHVLDSDRSTARSAASIRPARRSSRSSPRRRSAPGSSRRTRRCSARGSFTLGNHTFYNVERGAVRDHDAADRARGVVRHVVLPARRPDLGNTIPRGRRR